MTVSLILMILHAKSPVFRGIRGVTEAGHLTGHKMQFWCSGRRAQVTVHNFILISYNFHATGGWLGCKVQVSMHSFKR